MSTDRIAADLAAMIRNAVQSPATRDVREHPSTGIVSEIREHPEWGHVLFVDVPNRGPVECQPAYLGCGGSDAAPRGRFQGWQVGDQAIVMYLDGDSSAAVALPFGPANQGQPVPSGWDAATATRDNVVGRLEVRPQSTPGATVYPVVVKPFLDDLSTMLDTFNTAMSTIGALTFLDATPTRLLSTADVTNLRAMTTACTQLAAAITSLKCKVDASRTNANNPHLSGALQASYADPLGAVNCPT